MASDSVTGFFVLTADANRDRAVNTVDFNTLAANFGGNAKTFDQGNFNYAGLVDTADFNLLAVDLAEHSPWRCRLQYLSVPHANCINIAVVFVHLGRNVDAGGSRAKLQGSRND